MCKIKKNVNQTPIEIALGIDENGMTTARKLYDFLGMDTSHYSRWFKSNIENNQFAEENVDYFPFTINGECGGQASQDAKLTASFAKKISIQGKTEKAEQARNYFISVEDKAKDMMFLLKQASSNPMEMLKLHYAALEQVNKKVSDVDSKVDTVSSEVQTVRGELQDLKDDMPVFIIDAKDIQNAIRKKAIEVLGGTDSNAYHDHSIHGYAFSDIQIEVRRQFGVKRYDQIKHKDVPAALKIIEGYKPPLHIREKITAANAQLSLSLEGGAC